jgi:hypothetical protein
MDRGTAADAGEEISAGEGTMGLRVREEAAMIPMRNSYCTPGTQRGAPSPAKRRV